MFYNKTAAAKNNERRGLMEDINIVLANHEQKLAMLENEISKLKSVQAEIRTMNETLVTLATELKHTNEHLARHKKKIDEIEAVPKMRMQQIVTAIIAALSGGVISTVIGLLIKG